MFALINQSPSTIDTAHAVTNAVKEWKLTGIESIIAGNGMNITIVGMVVVFTALAIMSGTIYYIVVASQAFLNRASKRHAVAEKSDRQTGPSGEIIAAIVMALETRVFQLHDEEDPVLTIRRISRPYSPWSSKLHGMTKPPFRITSQSK